MNITLLFFIWLFLYILWEVFKFSVIDEEPEDNIISEEENYYEYEEEELVDDDYQF